MRKYMRLVWVCLAVLVLAAPSVMADPAPAGGDDEIRRAGQDDPKPKPVDEGAKKEEGDKKEAAAEEEEEGDTQQQQGEGSFLQKNFMFIMLGVIILMFVMMSRGRKKQEQKRQAMIAALKKGDKVTSIGGIVGTIIEMREDEVTVKVDETNNIRIKFARWAIRGKGAEAKTEPPENRR